MSVESISPVAGSDSRLARPGRAIRPVAGVLADGKADYLTRRRGAGWTWSAIAAESGQPPSWLRRQAAACGLIAPKARRPRPG